MIFLPKRACNAEVDGAGASAEAGVATSIGSDDTIAVADALGFSALVIGNNFGFSRGINFSIADGAMIGNVVEGTGGSSCVYD